MSITVAAPHELGPSELAAWRDMQAGAPALASPFLSPEFARAVGRQRPSARVAVLSDPDRPVGFFPFERRPLGLGVPIGSGVCDCQGLIHAPGLDWDAAELLRGCRLQLWRYDHLAEGQRPFETHVVDRAASPVIGIRDGFDSYTAVLEARSEARTRQLRTKERRLRERVGEVRLAFDETTSASLDTLMRWKSAQFRAKDRMDLFARPWAVALLRELHRTRAPGCTGTLSVLYAGERPVACHFGLRSRHVLQYWFPAYDPEAAPYSPGLLLLTRLAEAAAGEGIGLIDLGKGSEPYKEQLKTGDIGVTEGWTARPTLRSGARRVQAESAGRVRAAVAGSAALRSAALRTVNALPDAWKGC
ncbi:GNAT family N-acetyltransferase [Streptomyces sp. TRM49041]|uniref:GNAT family N-acetyltransferase n=1 Tax=Streptomyces sp. TRM49041 TaxID=2603216 RepID=UPI0011EE3571|nr:GNAT family N-acetyltransferase [Streptomyces sp. TRM49041]